MWNVDFSFCKLFIDFFMMIMLNQNTFKGKNQPLTAVFLITNLICKFTFRKSFLYLTEII
jgi:hypothetical protein